MSGDHFSLCWNNFHNNLSSGFNSLLQSEHLVDVTLAAEGKYLKAHKIVLSVCSQYFKELFNVNPCKHPIVILKDVSYKALKDLLQFMYQGEVNVSQEELGTFMKVAETLQIKGLTDSVDDNSTSHVNQNGIKNIQLVDVKNSETGPIKRAKTPSKKIVPNKIFKPNIEKPSTPISPNTPSRLETETPTSVLVEPDLEVIKPKTEPQDEPEEITDFNEHSLEIDMSSMVDTSFGESSSVGDQSQGSICWKSEIKPYISSDTNTPGGLRFLKTPKGRTVVIHNGHMYTLSHQKDTKTTWVCVMQRKLSCAGCVTTASGPMLLSYSGHNHSQLNDIIQRLDISFPNASK